MIHPREDPRLFELLAEIKDLRMVLEAQVGSNAELEWELVREDYRQRSDAERARDARVSRYQDRSITEYYERPWNEIKGAAHALKLAAFVMEGVLGEQPRVMEDYAELNIRCGYCEALPGEYCRTRSGYTLPHRAFRPVKFHKRRTEEVGA